MRDMLDYLPRQVNTGNYLTAYTLNELHRRLVDQPVVLPICSLGTQAEELASLAPLVLPPLYHEAMDERLKLEILARIQQCFPYYEGTQRRASCPGQLEIVELPRRQRTSEQPPKVLAFSIDTAVEQHGPHLPLATDTIQSYGVLRQLAREFKNLTLGPPLEYGQLTWGLPFGLSIDITSALLVRYVTGFINALEDWLSPAAMYVVDVHGSLVHRTAIVEGISASRCRRWAFRWLYEPLFEFTTQRGDQHAGGVETALVDYINPELVDSHWWPGRIAELVAGQLSMETVVQLAPDMNRFIAHVQAGPWNGIVGDVRNFFAVDAANLFDRMLAAARDDLEQLAPTEK